MESVQATHRLRFRKIQSAVLSVTIPSFRTSQSSVIYRYHLESPTHSLSRTPRAQATRHRCPPFFYPDFSSFQTIPLKESPLQPLTHPTPTQHPNLTYLSASRQTSDFPARAAHNQPPLCHSIHHRHVLQPSDLAALVVGHWRFDEQALHFHSSG